MKTTSYIQLPGGTLIKACEANAAQREAFGRIIIGNKTGEVVRRISAYDLNLMDLEDIFLKEDKAKLLLKHGAGYV